MDIEELIIELKEAEKLADSICLLEPKTGDKYGLDRNKKWYYAVMENEELVESLKQDKYSDWGAYIAGLYEKYDQIAKENNHLDLTILKTRVYSVGNKFLKKVVSFLDNMPIK